jgi:hypothetical protein
MAAAALLGEAEVERLKAEAANTSAYGLLVTSALALGAAYAAIGDGDWPMAAGFLVVLLLLANASAAERVEAWRCRRHAADLEVRLMDEWLQVWS